MLYSFTRARRNIRLLEYQKNSKLQLNIRSLLIESRLLQLKLWAWFLWTYSCICWICFLREFPLNGRFWHLTRFFLNTRKCFRRLKVCRIARFGICCLGELLAFYSLLLLGLDNGGLRLEEYFAILWSLIWIFPCIF